MDPNVTRYGWYSQEMYLLGGLGDVIWRHIDGREIRCTIISLSDTDHGTLWPDIELLGEVTHYIGKD
jgi:hypothetical protein